MDFFYSLEGLEVEEDDDGVLEGEDDDEEEDEGAEVTSFLAASL